MSAPASSNRITVLTESEIRRLVGFGNAELEAIAAVFPLISAGVGSMPPVQRIDVPEERGEIDIKSAYLPGIEGIAVKVSAGFFDNPTRGLPSLGGLMMVFDSTTGQPRAALFDNGHLTNLRTALAGAVAADRLAVADASTVGVIGAGVQARLQVEALRLVRDIRHVRVCARRTEAAERLVAELRAVLDLDAEVVDEPAAVAVDGGIVVTTTPATEPVLAADALRPGLHITAVGSDAEHKQELAVSVFEAADVVVCDSRRQSKLLGELRSVIAAGAVTAPQVELGELLDGTAAGRRSDDDVTICDLTGTGAQDTAIAALTVERAASTGIGTTLDI